MQSFIRRLSVAEVKERGSYWNKGLGHRFIWIYLWGTEVDRTGLADKTLGLTSRSTDSIAEIGSPIFRDDTHGSSGYSRQMNMWSFPNPCKPSSVPWIKLQGLTPLKQGLGLNKTKPAHDPNPWPR